MFHIDWFVGTMKKTFNIVVKEEDVSYEAYDFYHEDLDDLLVPVEHLEKLPNPLLFETLNKHVREFNPSRYYLSSDLVIIYFQQYIPVYIIIDS
ncbi:hypothetical protein [Peribacillus loiseleuriae]|uniref:Uncharacterized protein n=1 Tax=Peribacillus loiseleuriae TaxID=1679170 RepID=A0A0K9GZ87_9BACI|nr:hypothetical protein [Peribacillus loiseleuriae]KMY51915.1 hypothetical protein AC625_22280 [Peribacillus loiseleuriae]